MGRLAWTVGRFCPEGGDDTWRRRRRNRHPAARVAANLVVVAAAVGVTNPSKAIGPGDLAWSRLPIFQRRVEHALKTIQRVAETNVIGVSYSGGKDSTVVLDLVRNIIPDAPAGFWDSGSETEFDETYDLARHYNVEIVPSRMTLAEMCRSGGYWGYDSPTPDVEYNFMDALVLEPSHRFAVAHDIDCIAMGLRSGESAARRISYRKRGIYYTVKNTPPVTHHLCPIADWSEDDVIAYIASRELRYHIAYDLMAQAGIPRHEWRISVLLGSSGANLGRYVFLRQIAKVKYRALAAQFPKIARYT